MNNQIQFQTLTMRNFLSYGNNTTIVKFNESGTTMVLGEDLDNTANGQGANGVGKTTLINALAFALYDKPVSDISKDNLVNNINKKHMLVTVNFEKGNEVYHIERARKMKAGAPGNYVKFLRKLKDGESVSRPEYIGEQPYEDLSRSSKNTNALITKTIGIHYDLFCQIVVFSATKTPFLDLPVRHPQQTNQTTMIEELFGLTELSEKAEQIKKHTKLVVAELEKCEIRMGQIEREHARHADQIEKSKARLEKWAFDNQQNIKKLKNDLKSIEEVDVEAERKLHDEKKDLIEIKNKCNKHITNLEKDLKDQLKDKKKLNDEIKHLRDDKCPYCLQDFEGAEAKVQNIQHQLSEIEKSVSNITTQIGEWYVELEEIENSIDELNEKITVDNVEELITIKAQSQQIAEKITEMENANNPFAEPLSELENADLDPIDYTEINQLKKVIEHEKFLVKLLTKRDSFVRKVLLNKNLPFLNKRLSIYLNTLGLPHRVEFNGELVAEITRFGRPLDFGNLSNGQRARVNIALSFAFRDVLQKLHNPINVCLLDEVLDVGLDSVGVQAAAKMIKRLARDEGTSVYVISHREELDSSFDRTMVVQMSKGFSYIKEEGL